MSNVTAFRRPDDKKKAPDSVAERAKDNLEFIRSAMERSSRFTAVPGYGGVLMGVTAIVAAAFTASTEHFGTWAIIWFADACLAVAIGGISIWRKLSRSGEPLISAPARQFLNGFVPAILVAIVLTILLLPYQNRDLLASAWTLLYGAAVVAGGAYSVNPVRAMGWSFILLGLASVFFPVGSASLTMGLGFGVLHIVFGFLIGRRYGG